MTQTSNKTNLFADREDFLVEAASSSPPPDSSVGFETAGLPRPLFVVGVSSGPASGSDSSLIRSWYFPLEETRVGLEDPDDSDSVLFFLAGGAVVELD